MDKAELQKPGGARHTFSNGKFGTEAYSGDLVVKIWKSFLNVRVTYLLTLLSLCMLGVEMSGLV